jgi:surface antigen
MRPGKNLQNTPEFTAPQVPAEHDFLIPQVYETYCRELPGFISEFSDEQLIGRANNVRYQTPLLQYEDGYVSHRIVPGMFEPHIAKLVRSEALLQQRRSIFDSLISNGVEQVEAEQKATRATNLMAIPMVENAHDPVVQAEIRKELLYRADIAVTGAPAGFERFKEVVAGYKSTDVQNPWEVSKELFSRFQAQGRRVPPEARGRHFDLMVALGSATPDTRSLIAEIDGNRVSTTLIEAKMRLVFALHKQEMTANMRLGRKPDLVRIREKFQPLYDKLGYEYQDPSLSVQPSRVREGVMFTGMALNAGKQAVGHGVETAARVTAENVEQAARVTGVGMLGLGLLAPLVSHAPNIPERPTTTVSQLEITPNLPVIELTSTNTEFSAMPTAFEAAASKESLANQAFKAEIDRRVARSKQLKGMWAKWTTVDADTLYSSILKWEKQLGTDAIDRHLILAQLTQESQLKVDAVSYAGAKGLTQFMPGTWRSHSHGASPFDPDASVRAQFELNLQNYRMMKRNFPHKSEDQLLRLTLAAYNAGPNNHYIVNGHVPPASFSKGQTYYYVRIIMKDRNNLQTHLPQIAQSHPAPTPKPSPVHAHPAARGATKPTPASPSPIADFTNIIASGMEQTGPIMGNLTGRLDAMDQKKEAQSHAAALMTSIEAALASNDTAATDIGPAIDAPTSPLNRDTVEVSRSASREPLDFTKAIAQAIGDREAFSPVPAALTTESPATATPINPEHAAAALALQAVLAAPVPHIEHVPLPSAASALDALPSPVLPDLPTPSSPAHPSPVTPVLPDFSAAQPVTPPAPDILTPSTPDIIAATNPVTPPETTPSASSSPSLLDSVPVITPPSVSPSSDKSSLVDSLPSSPDMLTPQPGSGGGLLDAAPVVPDVTAAPQPSSADTAPALPQIVLAPKPPAAAPAPQLPATPVKPALPLQKPAPEVKSKGTEADIARELGISVTDLTPVREGMYLSRNAYKELGFDEIRKEYRRQYPNDNAADVNGMYTGQCVSWTGFRVDNDKYQPKMPNWGGRGNADMWMKNAKDAGITVNRTPAVGAAMEWYKSAGHSSAGHSAYVEKVLSDGSVLISEYNNIGPGMPSARVITPDEIKNNHAIRFIHFEK